MAKMKQKEEEVGRRGCDVSSGRAGEETRNAEGERDAVREQQDEERAQGEKTGSGIEEHEERGREGERAGDVQERGRGARRTGVKSSRAKEEEGGEERGIGRGEGGGGGGEEEEEQEEEQEGEQEQEQEEGSREEEEEEELIRPQAIEERGVRMGECVYGGMVSQSAREAFLDGLHSSSLPLR
eukprot:764226-Hanusia_phi.AAC.2